MIESIATSQEECRQVLEEEAGFSGATDSTFSELHDLVNACNSSIDGTYNTNKFMFFNKDKTEIL